MGTLILSQLSENAYNMKVTFRPDYEDTSSKDDTSKDDTSGGNTNSGGETSSEPEAVPGDTTDPEEPAE